ncbi:MAG: DUF1549 domain-containing protein [Planctomycetia bacterium]|nr:DUF1549 domain-containing protein [Planctomycetia bacterium]
MARITSTDPDLVMPPPHSKVTLTADEKRILAEWIAAGAEYRPHWAFAKPVKPAAPAVAKADWPRGDLDRFVLARLEREGLAPAAEADRAALCRRVHLDLVGLPPTPAELDAFLADEAADAYERLVDRLLASPRYGERWARRWLDVARYADTNGYEKDRDRPMWPWRDWVIRALNDDMPFDAFTLRQIAGDLLPGATPDDVLATGFHRNTMINEEGGIDPLEFRHLAMVDRVGTTGTVWLGLTIACAQCHTHKFDPVSHTDYYSLFALLNNADEPEWTITGEERARHLAATRQQIEDAWRTLPEKWPALPPGPEAPADEAARRAAARGSRFEAWDAAESARAVDWRIVRPLGMTSTMPHLVVRADGSILASGDTTKSDVYTIALPAAVAPVRALRLEVLADESLPNHGPGMTWYEGPKGEFFLSEFEVAAGGQRRGRGARALGGRGGGARQARGRADGRRTEHRVPPLPGGGAGNGRPRQGDPPAAGQPAGRAGDARAPRAARRQPAPHPPPSPRRVHAAQGGGVAGRAVVPAAAARGRARQPAGAGAVARVARQPAHRAGHREPAVAGLLRPRRRGHARGLRLPGRTAQPSGPARLARQDVRGRLRLVAQETAPPDRHERHLPAVGGGPARARGTRPGQRVAGARAAGPPRGRGDP